ncbi:hypothetical protein [Sulfurimonas sp.]|uniref:hypothetical protein n=1 Tax=Sulfurimonas sp. TaxID=2022749 RepID=UPI002AB1E121|nr:hypothetical protein [Sulfurimonas sp.]
MILNAIFAPLMDNLLLIIGAMVSVLSLIWASKQLLNFLGLETLNLKIEAKKQIRREDRQSKISQHKATYRKAESDKKQVKQIKSEEKKALKKYVESQKLKAKTEKKQRAENGRVIHVKKRLEYKTSIAQRIPKTKTSSSSSNSKRTTRREFMSKKYRDTDFTSSLQDKRELKYWNINQKINDRYMLNSPLTKNESGEVRMQNRNYKLGKVG